MLQNTFYSLDQIIDRQPLVVAPESSLYQVISQMQEWGNSCKFDQNQTDLTVGKNNSCALIVENSRLCGIFTERDLVRLVASSNSNIDQVKVGEVMSQDVLSLTSTGAEDIFTALHLLRQHGIRHLPVVDTQQNLLGLITAKNLRQKLQPINLMKWRKVSEVMQTKVVYASRDHSVKDIAKLMANHSLSCVAIADSELDLQTNNTSVRPVGIITERDILQFQNLDLNLEQPAVNLMSSPLFLVHPEDTLWWLHQQMERLRVRRLLVVDKQGKLAGIVTQSSLLQMFDPSEMYGVIEILQRQISHLKVERTKFLENRQAELEHEVKERTTALKHTNRQLQLEANLRQTNEQRFNSILNSLEDVVYSVDPNTFKVIYLNRATDNIYGRRTDEFYDNADLRLEIVHPKDQNRVLNFIQDVLKTQSGSIEYRIIRPDGEIRWLYDRTHLISDPNGKPVSIDGIVTDITSRKQAEILLKESQERYALAVKGSSNAVWDWNIATNQVFYAPQWQEILGCTDAELSPTFEAWQSRLHPEDGDRVLGAIQNHLKNRVPYNIEYRIRKQNQEYCWVQARGQAIWNRDGQALRMAGSIADVSVRKQREKILKDIASGMSVKIGENFFISLVEYLSKTLQVQYAYIGELTECQSQKIKTLAVCGEGKVLDNFEYDLAGTPCQRVIEQHLCVYPQEVQQLFPDSKLLPDMNAESFAGMPIVDATGVAIGLIAIVDSRPFDDIDLIEEVLKIFATRATAELERQQAQADLQRSNRILQAISSIQTQFLTDAKPSIVFDGMLDTFLELTESEYGFIGEILFAADGTPILEESYMKFRGRPYLKTHAITNIAWNEETRAFYAENAPKGMEFHNLQTLFGAVIVTGEPVIANSPSTDPRRGGLPDGHPPLNAFLGIPFYKNDKMTGMAGIANRQGGYNREIIHYLQPLIDTCSRIVEAHRSEREKQQAKQKISEQAALLNIATDAILVQGLDYRIQYWNQGAEKIYGWSKSEALAQNANELLYLEPFSDLEEIGRSLQDQNQWQGELQQVTKTGKNIVVQSRWTLVKDDAGKPQSFLIVNTDITAQKQLEKQFLRTQRLESLGTLAGGIAHDLNNILAPILGFARLIPVKKPDLDQQTVHFLKIIETNSQRGAALVKQILTFARGLEGDRPNGTASPHGILQIRHLITEIRQIVAETFPKSISLEMDISKDLWTINGDINQLHQVLMNLVVNARDAMPDGGTITIKAENFTVDTAYAKLNLDAKEGSYVLINVGDTGTGIPEAIIDRIFEPFFTTKAVGRGTGLGLSTVMGIVKSHDGFVEVVSNTNPQLQGTQVKVFLPASNTLSIASEPSEAVLEGNGELILVVDDETAILEAVAATLEAYNYRVLTASNGIDAIALYVQNQADIDVVLTDVMMPSMSGKTLIRTLKKVNPDGKIVVFSGLVSSREIVTELDGAIAGFINKPYTNDELLEMIAQVVA